MPATTKKDLTMVADLPKSVPWNAWVGVFLVLAIYFLSQLVGLVVLVYPTIKHWTSAVTSSWLTNSIYAQFFYVLIVEAFVVASVLLVIRLYKARPNIIGLRRPKITDPLFGLAAVPFYYIFYFIAVYLVSTVYKGLNVTQKQDVGFSGPHGPLQLVVTFISLVILPPIAEEILVRGLLYGSLKKSIPKLAAAIITSVLFASAHLLEGVGGLLWIGAIDTFILSMVMIYLREQTNGLWAGMTLHGVKNLIAYIFLYISPLVAFHL